MSDPEPPQAQHSRIYTPIAANPCSICMASRPTTYSVCIALPRPPTFLHCFYEGCKVTNVRTRRGFFRRFEPGPHALVHWRPNVYYGSCCTGATITNSPILDSNSTFLNRLVGFFGPKSSPPVPTGREQSSMMDGSVIVPLYVYPSLGAWGPIYDMCGPVSFPVLPLKTVPE